MRIKENIKKFFFGKKRYQSFFRRLFDISLEGMNIGMSGRDVHESGERQAIDHALKNETNPIVFDVGAQGGTYSREIIGYTGGRAKIYAFEPCSRDFQILKKLFHDDSVQLQNMALGECAGQAVLHYPPDVSGLSSLLKSDDGFQLSEKVKVETIDNFCRKNSIKYISLLKLDTEGYELSCLKGAKETLTSIKFIQFEMSLGSRDARVYFKDVFEYLKDYRIYRILQDGLEEVKSPDRLSEMLFTTNYLASRGEASGDQLSHK